MPSSPVTPDDFPLALRRARARALSLFVWSIILCVIGVLALLRTHGSATLGPALTASGFGGTIFLCLKTLRLLKNHPKDLPPPDMGALLKAASALMRKAWGLAGATFVIGFVVTALLK